MNDCPFRTLLFLHLIFCFSLQLRSMQKVYTVTVPHFGQLVPIIGQTLTAKL